MRSIVSVAHFRRIEGRASDPEVGTASGASERTMWRSFRTAARVTTALVAGAVVTLVAAYALLLVAGFKPVAVYSGSMRPTLGVGSLAVDRVAPAQTVRVGDVITFDDPCVKRRLVTHRDVRTVETKH